MNNELTDAAVAYIAAEAAYQHLVGTAAQIEQRQEQRDRALDRLLTVVKETT